MATSWSCGQAICHRHFDIVAISTPGSLRTERYNWRSGHCDCAINILRSNRGKEGMLSMEQYGVFARIGRLPVSLQYRSVLSF